MDEQHEWSKVAEVLGISRGRAYELVVDGEIPVVKIGRSVQASRKELDRWLGEHSYLDVA